MERSAHIRASPLGLVFPAVAIDRLKRRALSTDGAINDRLPEN